MMARIRVRLFSLHCEPSLTLDSPLPVNEKLDVSNYIEGSKLLGQYLVEYAALSAESS